MLSPTLTESPSKSGNSAGAVSEARNVLQTTQVYHDIETVYLVAGALYPGDHNTGTCKCRDCKGKIETGKGIRVYTWNGWTHFHLCERCARWRVEGVQFYWNSAFESWMFTFDDLKAEINGSTLAEQIWGPA